MLVEIQTRVVAVYISVKTKVPIKCNSVQYIFICIHVMVLLHVVATDVVFVICCRGSRLYNN